MTKEKFEKSGWKMTFDEFNKCDCPNCNKKDCMHRDAYRRVPRIDGGLGLCPNLKAENYNKQSFRITIYKMACSRIWYNILITEKLCSLCY